MPFPFLVLALLAPVPDSAPINVTGHAWAPFISPMGEPFRARSASDDTLANWFYQADRNRDGVLTPDEMQADADRFFATLDTNGDGQIDPEELAHYEYELAPEVQVMSKVRRVPGQPPPKVSQDKPDDRSKERRRERGYEELASLGIGGALQGAARYQLLNIPEPVAAADTDFNRAITKEEFRSAAVYRFQLLDSARQGRLTLAQLEAIPHAPSTDRKRRKLKTDAPDARLGNPLPHP
ncbi:MAG TPA: EF-hand domain-containing protein [Sphingomicrobium sp.]|nr:EF-hand domain-containing protein [Sphingomicrobium sp.]